jgi:hypothetical protein
MATVAEVKHAIQQAAERANEGRAMLQQASAMLDEASLLLQQAAAGSGHDDLKQSAAALQQAKQKIGEADRSVAMSGQAASDYMRVI